MILEGIGLTTSVISYKAVVISGVVFGALQLVKKLTNWCFLKGMWAVVANLVCTALGTVATTPPSHLFTQDTLTAIITSVILASGIHGISQTAVPAISVDPQKSCSTSAPEK